MQYRRETQLATTHDAPLTIRLRWREHLEARELPIAAVVHSVNLLLSTIGQRGHAASNDENRKKYGMGILRMERAQHWHG